MAVKSPFATGNSTAPADLGALAALLDVGIATGGITEGQG